jgi:hypothetical protein
MQSAYQLKKGNVLRRQEQQEHKDSGYLNGKSQIHQDPGLADALHRDPQLTGRDVLHLLR